ncbi:lipid biosynthesis B12-binding/radical SAM protein [Mesoterricola silvestris]|uniref:B12-binding domain-containing radical SAM protein n=1 Tax=Mesoterricola silvestris TaxID=2927979 RepID=A0AA48GHQ9_9BACT|nr:lipid biosynthesis B12-binding/radical SAM protein [Mesoterricola silvestris]BDU71457.1 B12-binding domain-containing radical SAM protein [Mesoterricola silvestris]
MSRILLVSANLTLEPYPVLPLGMAVVAGSLADRGHRVEQFDFLAEGASEAAFTDRVRACAPDFLGISLRNLDSCDSLARTDYPAVARRLVELARACTSAPIILGGSAFSILPEEILAYTGADYGVAGEGEGVAADLVEALAAGRAAPRISRAPGPAAAMAAPRFDGAIVRFYQEASGLLSLQTKRGCSHRCVYCNYPALEGATHRARDPRLVVDDLQEAHARFGQREFFIADAVFNDAAGQHMEVVEELARRALPIRWSCYMRPSLIREADLRLMGRAGLRAAELGTDATTDATLLGLGKGFTFQEAVEANGLFAACRIPCAHFVMFGGPGETEATVAEGLANLDRLASTAVFAFSGIRILPGTALHRLALQEGRVGAGDGLREPAYYHAAGLDPGAMEARIEAAFKGRRDRFFPPERGRERMAALRAMGFRGLIWDSLIRHPGQETPPC